MSHCVCARCYDDPLRLFVTIGFCCSQCAHGQIVTYDSNKGDNLDHTCRYCGMYYKKAIRIEDRQIYMRITFELEHPPCPTHCKHKCPVANAEKCWQLRFRTTMGHADIKPECGCKCHFMQR